MLRPKKSILATSAVVMGTLPLLLWAHEFGPDPGYSGVPGENASCISSQCHTGTANSFSTGSLAVSFPGGSTYTPGVKQHITVTISDTAATQRAWGFQLTARPSSAANTQAGVFLPTDTNTLLMCSDAAFHAPQALCLPGVGSCTNTNTPVCPANLPLQYMEHSINGYTKTKGAGSGSYEFDWTPPATSVGDVVVYVAGNAANGDLTPNGDHIYTKTFTLTAAAASSNSPAISANGVVSGASFQAGIVPGSWLTITGSNLSTVTDTWDKAIVNGKLPTTLDGVSVNIGSKPAFVNFISPTQINLQAPDVGTGPVPVTVTNANGTSAAFTATVAQQAPAFFLWPNSQAVATRNSDNSLAVKNGTFAGSTTVAAKPGDVIILWGTGFGPTTPTVAAGIQVPSDKLYSCTASITLGSTSPQVFGCALSPGFAGLYQVAIQVPSTMADGDYPIKATVNGTSSPDGVILSVKQ
jgi:uncharacterized protein (TIGR03437 family)